MLFKSQVCNRGSFDSNWPIDVVKNEPMLFNCDMQHAYQMGGAITRVFLEGLPSDWKTSDVVVDSRVHMLMPGWFPCIPGWHHDDVPRGGSENQPIYQDPPYESQHIMGLVNGEICPTRFVIGELDLSIPQSGVIYKQWHPLVQSAVDQGTVGTMDANSGVYYQFDHNAFHCGTSAVAGGWRWFVRVSRNTDRVKCVTNEIRKQVQVYLPHPMEGW